jgi:hypothetical protein
VPRAASRPLSRRSCRTLGVMSEATEPDSKILFRVVEEDGSAQVETLWATKLGNDEYQLDNSPFYAYSVSWQDVVHAPFSAAEGHATFLRRTHKSGNRTVRVILEKRSQSSEPNEVLEGLVALGCSYEGADGTLFSVNIPAAVELAGVAAYLVERGAQWEHADPTYAELYGDA